MKTKREAIVSVLSRYDDGSELKKMEKFKIPGRLMINIKRMIRPRLSNTKYDFKQLEK